VLLDCGTAKGMTLARTHCMPMFQQFQEIQVLTWMIRGQKHNKAHWLPMDLWKMVQEALLIVVGDACAAMDEGDNAIALGNGDGEERGGMEDFDDDEEL
jgi:hypothetical protein